MNFFSPKKGKPKSIDIFSTKAKVAPMHIAPTAPAVHAAATVPAAHVAAIPEAFPSKNNSPRNMYRHGFKPNRPMSNANKAALVTRRRAIMRPAARNYGVAAATYREAAPQSARPAIVIPANNNAGGAAAVGAAAVGAGADRGTVPSYHNASNTHQLELAGYERDDGIKANYIENMDAGKAVGRATVQAANNEFVNVNLGGGARRRKTHRRRLTHRNRS